MVQRLKDPEQALDALEQMRRLALSSQASTLLKQNAVAELLRAAAQHRTEALRCLIALAAHDMEEGQEVRPSARAAREQLRLVDLEQLDDGKGGRVQLAHLLGYCRELEDERALGVLRGCLEGTEEVGAQLGPRGVAWPLAGAEGRPGGSGAHLRPPAALGRSRRAPSSRGVGPGRRCGGGQ